MHYIRLMQKHQRGFTLVELSIVLVILGLLIGGVLTGQSLIRAAELRSVSTQFSQYVTAAQTFRDKYFALPGDMANASAYWGAADNATGYSSTCIMTASTDIKTCNGNGDGRVTLNGGSYENYRFWQHLANAGLIEGAYTGAQASGGATSVNTPRGKISSSLWYPEYSGYMASGVNTFDGQLDNFLEFGGLRVGDAPSTPIVKPEEAYNIDTKMDDGKPATGKVIMRGYITLADCSDSNVSSNMAANYKLTNSAVACDLWFRNAF